MTAHAIILQHVLAEDAGLLTPILHDYGYTVTMIETPIHSVTTTQALDADLLIAVTASDELNLLTCLIAKKSGNCQTI